MKMNMITSILRILKEDTHVSITQSQKEATFNSYLTKILSIQSTLDESRDPDTSRSEHIQLPNNLSETCNDGRISKKPWEVIIPDSDDDDDKPNKKQKNFENDMPWFIPPDNSFSLYSDPNCKETCRLLWSYNQDISKAKFLVKIALNSPSGIPSSQWEWILKGNAINLNQIFASFNHVIPDEGRTGHLGDMEIVFGTSESKKQITAASEWSSACRRASKTIRFAFPHQKEELLKYGDYIECEFATKLVSSHHKLILYNITLTVRPEGCKKHP